MLGLINFILRVIIFLAGLGGPAITFVLYESGENWIVDPIEYLIPISIAYIISVIIAVIVHFLVKNLWICILTSTGICILTYLLLTMIFLFDLTDPEEFMWLSVGLIFVFINCFPMAFSTSGSTILQIRFNAFIKALIKEFK